MDYRVLIKLYVPEIESEFEYTIPVNKSIYQVANLLNKAVNNSMPEFPIKEVVHLCNRNSGILYNNTDIIRNTNIRNGTELIMY